MSDTGEISVEVTLRPNDVFHPFMWLRFNLWRWVVAIVLCLVVWDRFLAPESSLNTYPDAEALREVIIAITVLILFGLLVFPYLRMLAAFRASPALQRKRRVTFSSDGILWNAQDADANTKWPLFTDISETPRSFVFQTGKYSAGTYVPKRCFSSHDQIVQLRQLIRTNFHGKLRLRND
jgi:hypothetical protein